MNRSDQWDSTIVSGFLPKGKERYFSSDALNADDGVAIAIICWETKGKGSSTKQTVCEDSSSSGILQVASHLETAYNQNIRPQKIPVLKMTPSHIGSVWTP